jgi:hypothetical protein
LAKWQLAAAKMAWRENGVKIGENIESISEMA